MLEKIRSLIASVESERLNLNQVRSSQLNSKVVRDRIRGLALQYFDGIRSGLSLSGRAESIASEIDQTMRQLIPLCHSRGMTRRYKTLLTEAKKGLIELEAAVVSAQAAPESDLAIEMVDHRIIESLQELEPNAALSYHQAVIDLRSDDRISWRGPATDLREALREVLDVLAPDKEVTQMAGYKQVDGTAGPTMRQKIRFILRSRGQSRASVTSVEEATDALESALGAFVRSVYTRSSVSTHTPTDKSEVLRVRDLVRVVLCELLEIHT